ncbi:hypothetical protein XENORESO_002519 [Xenotaenia resolanae]|uniref:Uncharacterized protein n=1 Tax=Xenotaenia resolanae TaxID=208358 RepID=A0ABV0W0T7_9TELE
MKQQTLFCVNVGILEIFKCSLHLFLRRGLSAGNEQGFLLYSLFVADLSLVETCRCFISCLAKHAPEQRLGGTCCQQLHSLTKPRGSVGRVVVLQFESSGFSFSFLLPHVDVPLGKALNLTLPTDLGIGA